MVGTIGAIVGFFEIYVVSRARGVHGTVILATMKQPQCVTKFMDGFCDGALYGECVIGRQAVILWHEPKKR
jgi:hypothetical protein